MLLQRTTAKEQARRLIAAELPERFVREHRLVVVENHLNMIRPLDGAPKVPPAVVAALLNSEVVDHAFRCISGSVAVSAFELGIAAAAIPESGSGAGRNDHRRFHTSDDKLGSPRHVCRWQLVSLPPTPPVAVIRDQLRSLPHRAMRSEMERSPRPQDISWFLDLRRREQLDLDPPYQRKSVWTRGDKQFFLDTIFHNYPCPAVFLHKTIDDEGESVYHVVDGKQRLQTILDFVHDQVSIPRDFGDLRLAGRKWSQLDPDSKKAFWNYLITVEMLPDVDDVIVNNVFERINRNARNLMRQELRHAKFEGWLIKRAESEAEKQEWKDFGIVTTARAKRMSDVQFISEIIILTLRREIAGFDQDMIDRYYAEFDVPSETAPVFDEEEFDRALEEIKSTLMKMNEINECVTRYGRTLAHFYSLWGYLLLAKSPEAQAGELAQRYAGFMERVVGALGGDLDLAAAQAKTPEDKAVTSYAMNVRGANTDTTPRTERHNALVAALKSWTMKIPTSIRSLYAEQREPNERLKDKADQTLRLLSSRKNWHYESRIKSELSVALKLESGRVRNPLAVEDFFACTLVVRNLSEIAEAEEELRGILNVVERRPPSVNWTHKAADAFPFDDVRLYANWKDDPALPPSKLDSIRFEIQIKTFLQHAWGIATHDLVYKTDDVSWSSAADRLSDQGYA